MSVTPNTTRPSNITIWTPDDTHYTGISHQIHTPIHIHSTGVFPSRKRLAQIGITPYLNPHSTALGQYLSTTPTGAPRITVCHRAMAPNVRGLAPTAGKRKVPNSNTQRPPASVKRERESGTRLWPSSVPPITGRRGGVKSACGDGAKRSLTRRPCVRLSSPAPAWR